MKKIANILVGILVLSFVLVVPAHASDVSKDLKGLIGYSTYTITYDANGGSGSYATDPIETESEVVVLSLDETGITRDGFAFTGWNRAKDGSGKAYAAGDTITLYENIVLYAQWKEIVLEPEKPLGPGLKPPGGDGSSSTPQVPPSSSGSSAPLAKTGDTAFITLMACLAVLLVFACGIATRSRYAVEA